MRDFRNLDCLTVSNCAFIHIQVCLGKHPYVAIDRLSPGYVLAGKWLKVATVTSTGGLAYNCLPVSFSQRRSALQIASSGNVLISV